jgi:hypothetical protein
MFLNDIQVRHIKSKILFKKTITRWNLQDLKNKLILLVRSTVYQNSIRIVSWELSFQSE